MQDETQTTVESTETVVETPETVVESTETAPVQETTTEPKRDDFIPKSRFNEVYADKKRLERLLEQTLAGQKKEERAEAPKTEEAAPDPKQYEGREAEYYAALGAYSGRQEAKRILEQEKAQQSQKQAQEAANTATENYRSKVGAEVAKDPALLQDLENLNSIQWPAQTALLLEGHEHAGLLAKHMARNLPEAHELARLAQTNPIVAAMKIGELGAKLQGSAQPVKTPQKPKAPELIDSVRGGGKQSPDYVPGVSSTADYIRKFYPLRANRKES